MDGFDLARLIARLGPTGHGGHLGLRYRAHGPDWVEIMLAPDPRLMVDAESGVFASGPVVAMMDTAASFAIWARIGAMVPQATLDLRVDYLRPSGPGRTLIGRGECYRVTRNVAFVRGQAHEGDADDPIAHVAGTFMFLDPAPRA